MPRERVDGPLVAREEPHRACRDVVDADHAVGARRRERASVGRPGHGLDLARVAAQLLLDLARGRGEDAHAPRERGSDPRPVGREGGGDGLLRGRHESVPARSARDGEEAEPRLRASGREERSVGREGEPRDAARPACAGPEVARSARARRDETLPRRGRVLLEHGVREEDLGAEPVELRGRSLRLLEEGEREVAARLALALLGARQGLAHGALARLDLRDLGLRLHAAERGREDGAEAAHADVAARERGLDDRAELGAALREVRRGRAILPGREPEQDARYADRVHPARRIPRRGSRGLDEGDPPELRAPHGLVEEGVRAFGVGARARVEPDVLGRDAAVRDARLELVEAARYLEDEAERGLERHGPELGERLPRGRVGDEVGVPLLGLDLADREERRVPDASGRLEPLDGDAPRLGRRLEARREHAQAHGLARSLVRRREDDRLGVARDLLAQAIAAEAEAGAESERLLLAARGVGARLRLELTEVAVEVRRAPVAGLRVLVEELHDDPREARRDAGRPLLQTLGLALHVEVSRLERRRAPERDVARGELVEHDAQGVEVHGVLGLGAVGAALGLLGRHVLRRPDGEPGERERLARALAAHAEVGDLGPPRAPLGEQEHVRRLEVAVDDPLLVDRLEALSHIERDAEDDRLGDRLSARAPRADEPREVARRLALLGGPAARELEGEPVVALGLAVVDVTDDVGMPEQARAAHLGDEAPERLVGASELDREHLERGGPPLGVLDLVDVGHAARRYEAHDAVAVHAVAGREPAPRDERVASHLEALDRRAARALRGPLHELLEGEVGIARHLRVELGRVRAGGNDPLLLAVREEEEVALARAGGRRLDEARRERQHLLRPRAREVGASRLEPCLRPQEDRRERRGEAAIERGAVLRDLALAARDLLARHDEPEGPQRREVAESARERPLELGEGVLGVVVDDPVPQAHDLSEPRVEAALEEGGRELGVEGARLPAAERVAEEP